MKILLLNKLGEMSTKAYRVSFQLNVNITTIIPTIVQNDFMNAETLDESPS